MKRIYLSPPHLDGRERELLIQAYESNWITTLGPHIDAFEEEVCKNIGVKHATALASGTAALHLALLTLGVRRGDIVLCSDLTFAASANAICYCGAEPVFIDSDRTTWNMDPRLLEEELEACVKRGSLPKAAIVVDIYGQCANYAPILKICQKYEIPMIEDATEALGATYKETFAGKFGVDRETVRLTLEAHDIESRPIWKPMHMQPVFKDCRVRGGAVSEDLFKRGLCLPSGTQLTEEDLDRIVRIIKSCCKENK